MPYSTTPASGSSSSSTVVITPGEPRERTPSALSTSSAHALSKGKQRASSSPQWYTAAESGGDEGMDLYDVHDVKAGWISTEDDSDGSNYAPPGQYVPRPHIKRHIIRPIIRRASTSTSSSLTSEWYSQDERTPYIPTSHRKRRKTIRAPSTDSAYGDDSASDTSLPRRPGQRSIISCIEIPYDKALARRIAGGAYVEWSEPIERASRSFELELCSSQGGETREEAEVEAVIALDYGSAHGDEVLPPEEVTRISIEAEMEVWQGTPADQGSTLVGSSEREDSDFFEIIQSSGSGRSDVEAGVTEAVARRESAVIMGEEQESIGGLVVAVEWRPPTPPKKSSNSGQTLIPTTASSFTGSCDRELMSLQTEEMERSCHQCRRTFDGPHMACSHRPKNHRCPFLFCESCCSHYTYFTFAPKSRTFVCPRCRDVCKCAVCIRRRQLLRPKNGHYPHLSTKVGVQIRQPTSSPWTNGVSLNNSAFRRQGPGAGKAALLPLGGITAEKKDSKGQKKAERSSPLQTRQTSLNMSLSGGPGAARTHPPIILRLRRPQAVDANSAPIQYPREVDSDGDTVCGPTSEEDEASAAESSVTSRGNSRSPLPQSRRLLFRANLRSSSTVPLSTNEYLSSFASLSQLEVGEKEAEEEGDATAGMPSPLDPTAAPMVPTIRIAGNDEVLGGALAQDDVEDWPRYIYINLLTPSPVSKPALAPSMTSAAEPVALPVIEAERSKAGSSQSVDPPPMSLPDAITPPLLLVRPESSPPTSARKVRFHPSPIRLSYSPEPFELGGLPLVVVEDSSEASPSGASGSPLSASIDLRSKNRGVAGSATLSGGPRPTRELSPDSPVGEGRSCSPTSQVREPSSPRTVLPSSRSPVHAISSLYLASGHLPSGDQPPAPPFPPAAPLSPIEPIKAIVVFSPLPGVTNMAPPSDTILQVPMENAQHPFPHDGSIQAVPASTLRHRGGSPDTSRLTSPPIRPVSANRSAPLVSSYSSQRDIEYNISVGVNGPHITSGTVSPALPPYSYVPLVSASPVRPPAPTVRGSRPAYSLAVTGTSGSVRAPAPAHRASSNSSRTPLGPVYSHYTPGQSADSSIHHRSYNYPNQSLNHNQQQPPQTRNHQFATSAFPPFLSSTSSSTADSKTAFALESALAQLRNPGWNGTSSRYYR